MRHEIKDILSDIFQYTLPEMPITVTHVVGNVYKAEFTLGEVNADFEITVESGVDPKQPMFMIETNGEVDSLTDCSVMAAILTSIYNQSKEQA
jgi:hypothetical protein